LFKNNNKKKKERKKGRKKERKKEKESLLFWTNLSSLLSQIHGSFLSLVSLVFNLR